MGIGNITSKLASGAKEVAKTFKETSAPKIKKAVEQKVKVAAEIAQDAYGRAAVKFSKETDAEKIKKLSTEAIDATKNTPLKEQVAKSSYGFADGTKLFYDKNGKKIGSYGINTISIQNPNKLKSNLMEETIKKADGKLYKSADELTSEAEKGAKAVISAMGETSGKYAMSSASVFKEHGKTAIEKRLDEAAETASKKAADALAKAQRKADLQAKYGDKLAKAKGEQLKQEALKSLAE